MKFTVGTVAEFSAIHALNGDFGEETIPHNHDYRVEWKLVLDQLDENGFAVNIAHIELALTEVLAKLSGVRLNETFFCSQTE